MPLPGARPAGHPDPDADGQVGEGGEMSRTIRVIAALTALALVVGACTEESDSTGGNSGGVEGDAPPDYEAIGLWDDGPCDDEREPLRIGLMTVFSSPVISLESQALALEASAEAFNARGGANGACIEVHTCDDGADPNQAIQCVRDIDAAGVVATVHDQGVAAPAEVGAAMADAGIPRVATNVTPDDFADPNAYPLYASGTGVTLMMPQALVDDGITDIGLVRVDLPGASALVGFFDDIYGDSGAEFGFDVPVPAGTTDYSQFILGAENAGVGGITIALGEQEAVQVIRAAEQLDSDLVIASPLYSQSAAADFGEIVEQMKFVAAFPPATFDLPVYQALRRDLAASGERSLQPENLDVATMGPWIGLYGLLWMIRDTGMTEFSREGITGMLRSATDVPMLGMFGGEDWTPDENHEGLIQRVGTTHWQTWTWDPDAEAFGVQGNFVPGPEFDFDEVLCGSPLGAPEPC